MRFVRILPSTDVKMPGSRLRLDYDPDEHVLVLADEGVLSEQVLNPDARNVTAIATIDLSVDQLPWLHDSLGELRATLAGEAAPTVTEASGAIDVSDDALRTDTTASNDAAALELARGLPLTSTDPTALLLAAALVRLTDRLERWRWTPAEREQLSRFVERQGELYAYTAAAIVRVLDEQRDG